LRQLASACDIGGLTQSAEAVRKDLNVKKVNKGVQKGKGKQSQCGVGDIRKKKEIVSIKAETRWKRSALSQTLGGKIGSTGSESRTFERGAGKA